MHCNAYLLALQRHNFRRFQLLADSNKKEYTRRTRETRRRRPLGQDLHADSRRTRQRGDARHAGVELISSGTSASVECFPRNREKESVIIVA